MKQDISVIEFEVLLQIWFVAFEYGFKCRAFDSPCT
jgi:hypothetical protein